jgi:Zn-dependent protease with chaperone function
MTTGTPATGAAERCPRCSGLAVGGGTYVTWCPGCDWNVLTGSVEPRPHTRRSARRQAVAAIAAERLYRSLEGREVSRPGWDLRRVSSYLLAVGVHASTLALVLGGLAIIVLGLPSVFLTLVGLVVLTLGLATRPRLGRLPTGSSRLDRAEAPETWRLLDEVAAAVGMPPPDALLFNTDLNAATWTVGLRRRRVIELGMGLQSLLTPQELVGILAHEVAHGSNGDLRQGLVVGSAMRTLAEWGNALEDVPDDQGEPVESAAAQLATLMGAMLQIVPRTLLSTLQSLQFRSSQRAEYLADQIGAEVAGSEAMTSALQALVLADPAWDAMRRAAIRDEPDLWGSARSFRADLPPTEIERRGRAGRSHAHAVDATHPPTMLRADLVRSREGRSATVVLDAGRAQALDIELATAARGLTTRLRGELLDDM